MPYKDKEVSKNYNTEHHRKKRKINLDLGLRYDGRPRIRSYFKRSIPIEDDRLDQIALQDPSIKEGRNGNILVTKAQTA